MLHSPLFLISDFGDASSVMLTTVFGLELMYLGIVPKLPRFRKKTELKRSKNAMLPATKKTFFNRWILQAKNDF